MTINTKMEKATDSLVSLMTDFSQSADEMTQQSGTAPARENPYWNYSMHYMIGRLCNQMDYNQTFTKERADKSNNAYINKTKNMTQDEAATDFDAIKAAAQADRDWTSHQAGIAMRTLLVDAYSELMHKEYNATDFERKATAKPTTNEAEKKKLVAAHQARLARMVG